MTSAKLLQKGLYRRLDKLTDEIEDFLLKPIVFPTAINLKESLVDYWQKIDAYQDEIISSLEDESEAISFFDSHESYEIKYRSVLNKLNEKIQVNSTSSTVQSTSSTTSELPIAEVRLPQLNLPTFSGNYIEWEPFKDQFFNTIDKRQMAPGDKLQYLKGLLRGEAQHLLSNIPVTDRNYEIALEALKNRYDHKREIVFAYINRLLNQPNARTEKDLRKLVDTTNECLYNLKSLGENVDEWNSVLVYLVMEKQDPITRREFSIQIAKEIPKLEDALNFMENKCHAFVSSKSAWDEPVNKTTNSTNYLQFSNKTTSLQCPICAGNHVVFKCQQFMVYSIEERNSLVRKKQLCINCLNPNHGVKDCRSSSCRKCNQKHHTLLHRETLVTASAAKEEATCLLSTAQTKTHVSCHTSKHALTLKDFERLWNQERAQQQQNTNINSSRYKTKLCRPFEESGSCKYGDKCQFAHGAVELRSFSRHPKYKTELCKTFHTSVFCPYGPRCHFIHTTSSKPWRRKLKIKK